MTRCSTSSTTWPRLRGTFLAYDNGFRRWSFSYAEVSRAARGLWRAPRRGRASTKGDAVIFWSENRPEWIAALWGCWLQGVVAVPIDYRASPDFLRRVAGIVERAPGAGRRRGGPRPGRPDAGVAAVRVRLARDGPRRRAPTVTRDDTAEIIFTSGATAEPKGVVITHRNILANIVPVEREILKYRKYARPFSPIRFLNLLPLSHMFGQSMATFIPPLLAGTVVFMRGFNPHDIVRQIKSRRVSVLVSVPKILDVLREHVLRVAPESAEPPPGKEHFTRRWWRYRRAHRLFGLKFWSFVVGAAPLDPSLEEFWGRLGFVVIQGYGLTETAPIVSLNHPFSASKGSVGKAIAGVEVKIAEDGEILVRGDNVTKGYFGAAEATAEAFEGGWFHTGDIGEVDADGRHLHQGPQEGDDRHAGRAQRLSGRRRARRGRAAGRARCRGRRRQKRRRRARARRRRHRARRGPAVAGPAGQPGAARSSEDSRHLGVAGRGTAAHRGHAEAEAAAGARLGRVGRHRRRHGRARVRRRGAAGAVRRRTRRRPAARRSTSWASARSNASS